MPARTPSARPPSRCRASLRLLRLLHQQCPYPSVSALLLDWTRRGVAAAAAARRRAAAASATGAAVPHRAAFLSRAVRPLLLRALDLEAEDAAKVSTQANRAMAQLACSAGGADAAAVAAAPPSSASELVERADAVVAALSLVQLLLAVDAQVRRHAVASAQMFSLSSVAAMATARCCSRCACQGVNSTGVWDSEVARAVHRLADRLRAADPSIAGHAAARALPAAAAAPQPALPVATFLPLSAAVVQAQRSAAAAAPDPSREAAAFAQSRMRLLWAALDPVLAVLAAREAQQGAQ